MSNDFSPTVTVVIPCRNEERYIGKVLDNLLEQTYPKDKLEIVVADGLSTDATTRIVESYIQKYSYIRLIENPAKFVPAALNKAIRESRADVIVRLDAHAEYPPDYIEVLVKALYIHQVDNAGGVWQTEPGAQTREAHAIVAATTHPFGIGNAQYRLASGLPRLVDTVPFGCYRREIFEKIGYFDEQMVRNQDDEFNGRLIKSGGKILLLPQVKIRYFSRASRKHIRKMYYQYGLFKPLVNIKLGKPATLRQLFPPLLTGGLLLSLVLTVWKPVFIYLFLIIFSSYLFLLLLFSFRLGREKGLIAPLLQTFSSIHFSYGWGYLSGIWRFVICREHNKGRKLEVGSNR